MTPDILIGAVSAILVALLGAGTKHLIDLRKQKSDQSLTANEQAFLFYKNLVETLQKHVQDLIKDSAKMEIEYIATRESNAELKSEIKHLKEKIEGLEIKLLKFTPPN